MHLVGFIIRSYHAARSAALRQIPRKNLAVLFVKQNSEICRGHISHNSCLGDTAAQLCVQDEYGCTFRCAPNDGPLSGLITETQKAVYYVLQLFFGFEIWTFTS